MEEKQEKKGGERNTRHREDREELKKVGWSRNVGETRDPFDNHNTYRRRQILSKLDTFLFLRDREHGYNVLLFPHIYKIADKSFSQIIEAFFDPKNSLDRVKR